MKHYSVNVLPSAQREMARLPVKEWKQIARRIDALAENPRFVGSQKLQGSKDRYRASCGNYRVLYRIDDESHEVFVYAVGDRKDVYR